MTIQPFQPLPLYPTLNNYKAEKIPKNAQFEPTYSQIQKLGVSAGLKQALYFTALIFKACENKESTLLDSDDQLLIHFNDEEGFGVDFKTNDLISALQGEVITDQMFVMVKGREMVASKCPNEQAAEKLAAIAHALLEKNPKHQLALYLLLAALCFGKKETKQDLIYLLPGLKARHEYLKGFCQGTLTKRYPNVVFEMIKEGDSHYFSAAVELLSNEKGNHYEKIKELLPHLETRSQEERDFFFKKFPSANPFHKVETLNQALSKKEAHSLFFLFRQVGIRLIQQMKYLDAFHFFTQKKEILENHKTFFFEREVEKLLAALRLSKRPLSIDHLFQWIMHVLKNSDGACPKSIQHLSQILDKANKIALLASQIHPKKKELIIQLCEQDSPSLAAQLMTDGIEISHHHLQKMLESLPSNKEKMAFKRYLPKELVKVLYQSLLKDKDAIYLHSLVDQVPLDPSSLQKTVEIFIHSGFVEKAQSLMITHVSHDFGDLWTALIKALEKISIPLTADTLLKFKIKITNDIVIAVLEKGICLEKKLKILVLYELQDTSIWVQVYDQITNSDRLELVELSFNSLKHLKKSSEEKQLCYKNTIKALIRLKSRLFFTILENPPLLNEQSLALVYLGALTHAGKCKTDDRMLIRHATSNERRILLVNSPFKNTNKKIQLVKGLLPNSYLFVSHILEGWFTYFDDFPHQSQQLLISIFLEMEIKKENQWHMLAWTLNLIHLKQPDCDRKIVKLISFTLENKVLDDKAKRRIKAFILNLMIRKESSLSQSIEKILDKINNHDAFDSKDRSYIWADRLLMENLESEEARNYFYRHLSKVTEKNDLVYLIPGFVSALIANLKKTKNTDAYQSEILKLCIAFKDPSIKPVVYTEIYEHIVSFQTRKLAYMQQEEALIKDTILKSALSLVEKFITNATHVPEDIRIELIEEIVFVVPFGYHDPIHLLELGCKLKLFNKEPLRYFSMHFYSQGFFPPNTNQKDKKKAFDLLIAETPKFNPKCYLERIYTLVRQENALIWSDKDKAIAIYEDLITSLIVLSKNNNLPAELVESLLETTLKGNRQLFCPMQKPLQIQFVKDFIYNLLKLIKFQENPNDVIIITNAIAKYISHLIDQELFSDDRRGLLFLFTQVLQDLSACESKENELPSQIIMNLIHKVQPKTKDEKEILKNIKAFYHQYLKEIKK